MFGKITLDKHNLWVQKIKDKRESTLNSRVRSTRLGNGKHITLFDMSALWTNCKNLIADFLVRVEGETRTKDKILKFHDILYSPGIE